MENVYLFFKTLYKNFNDREIELVISSMAEDVKWANGMEGGYVHGHNGVREYWTRQFKTVNSNVTPMEIEDINGVIKIKVHQVVHDLDKNLLADETAEHFFYLQNDKITEFNIGKN